jgi:hypothetical protein
MMCGNIGCSHRQQLRQEASLRKTLILLRSEIGQFTLDNQRALELARLFRFGSELVQ